MLSAMRWGNLNNLGWWSGASPKQRWQY